MGVLLISNPILIDDIVGGIAVKLSREFAGVQISSERISTPRFPRFFIEILSDSMNHLIGESRSLRFFIRVSYYHAQDLIRVSNLQRVLGEVNLRVKSTLEEIPLYGRHIYSNDLRTEVVENVLHVFFNVKVPAALEEIVYAKQMQLELNREVN